MRSLKKTKTERATAGPAVHGDARFHRSELWVAWMPAEASTRVEAGEDTEPPLPILTMPDGGRLQWFSRAIGILVILCLVLAVVVWWRLLS